MKFIRDFNIFFEHLKLQFREKTKRKDVSLAEAFRNAVATDSLNLDQLEFTLTFLTDELIFFGLKRQIGKSILELASLLYLNIFRHELFSPLFLANNNSSSAVVPKEQQENATNNNNNPKSPTEQPHVQRADENEKKNALIEAQSKQSQAQEEQQKAQQEKQQQVHPQSLDITPEKKETSPENAGRRNLMFYEHHQSLQILRQFVSKLEYYTSFFPKVPQLSTLKYVRDELKNKLNLMLSQNSQNQ